MDLTELNNLVELLKTRPSMVLGAVNFDSAKYFLYGYIHALDTERKISLNREISAWWIKKQNRQSSPYYWFDQILIIDCDNDKDKAFAELLECLTEYIEEHKLKRN